MLLKVELDESRSNVFTLGSLSQASGQSIKPRTGKNDHTYKYCLSWCIFGWTGDGPHCLVLTWFDIHKTAHSTLANVVLVTCERGNRFSRSSFLLDKFLHMGNKDTLKEKVKCFSFKNKKHFIFFYEHHLCLCWWMWKPFVTYCPNFCLPCVSLGPNPVCNSRERESRQYGKWRLLQWQWLQFLSQWKAHVFGQHGHGYHWFVPHPSF